MKTLIADVSGIVQGVGFRYFVGQAAEGLGVEARADNMDDGTVHVVATGEEAQLLRLVELLRHGSHYSQVKRVEYTIVEHGPGARGS